MQGMSVSERLATDGMRQHLYTEPTVVAEDCGGVGDSCRNGCCGGLTCDERSYTCWCQIC